MRGGTSSKTKLDKPVASEVVNARSKLNGVLQTLLIKVEDSSSSSDDETSQSSPEPPPPEMMMPVPSPSKRTASSHRLPRKRRKKEGATSKDSVYGQQTYIMKLFDRSVNLAQFSEEASLYPVVRAWMKNEPHGKKKNGASGSGEESGPASPLLQPKQEPVDDDEVCEEDPLPSLRPLSLPSKPDGTINYLRVPTPLPQPDEKLDITEDSSFAPTGEHLLTDHMVRWKAVRQRWKDASLTNEGRYKESLNHIKTLFVR